MNSAEILEAAKTLPLLERIELARDIWDDIAAGDFDVVLTPDAISELDCRADDALKNPAAGVPAEKVFADIQEQLRGKR